MAGTMFGAPEGDLAWDANNLALTKGAVDIEHQLGQIAMQPQQAELLRQNARLHGAQADEHLQKVGDQKLAGELAQLAMQRGAAGGRQPSTLDVLSQTASGLVAAGKVTAGIELLTKVGAQRQHEAAIINSLVTAEMHKITTFKEKAILAGQLYQDVKNQEDLDQRNRQWKFQAGEDPGPEFQEYSPELIQRVTNAAISAQHMADIEERRLTRKAIEEYRTSRLGQIDTQNTIRQSLADIRRRAQDWREKQGPTGGGRTIGIPGKEELDYIKRRVREDFPGISPTDIKDAAFDVAAQARALRNTNRALSPEMALQQAYTNSREDFVAAQGQVFDTHIPGWSTAPTYTGRGKSPETALSQPKKVDQVKVGKYYRLADGRIVVGAKVGNKVGFVPAPTGGGGGGADGSLEDASDE